jgi:hypothetical protein
MENEVIEIISFFHIFKRFALIKKRTEINLFEALKNAVACVLYPSVAGELSRQKQD